MKKLSRAALLLSLLTGTLVACTRPAPAPSPVGTWMGYYNSDPSAAVTTGDNPYTAVVREDGTVTFYNGSLTAPVASQGVGTWTFIDNTFKATYSYPSTSTYSVSATLTDPNRMDGTWGEGNSSSGEGKFYLIRQ